jgi:hypothetical protein
MTKEILGRRSATITGEIQLYRRLDAGSGASLTGD